MIAGDKSHLGDTKKWSKERNLDGFYKDEKESVSPALQKLGRWRGQTLSTLSKADKQPERRWFAPQPGWTERLRAERRLMMRLVLPR